jgi:hypothetical protein
MQAFSIWRHIPPLFTFYSPFMRPLFTYHSPTISLLSTFYQPSTIPVTTTTQSTIELQVMADLLEQATHNLSAP